MTSTMERMFAYEEKKNKQELIDCTYKVENKNSLFSKELHNKYLIFHHISLTGGSCINDMLVRMQDYSGVKFIIPNPEQAYSDPSGPWESLPRPTVISGHHVFGLHKKIKEPTSYFGFLRDPYKQIFSSYKYLADIKVKDLAYQWSEFDWKLDELKEKIGHLNIQSYENATYWNEKPSKEIVTVAGQKSLQNLVGTSPSELLRKAQKNIDNQFFFVGITELFEESIFLLFDMIGIKETLLWRPGLYSYWRLNKEEMPISIFKKLSLLIEADLELYHENRMRLEETLKTAEFGEQLTRYKTDARNPYRRLYGELSERLNIAALSYGLNSEVVTNELAHSQAIIHNINSISEDFENWREAEMARINGNQVNRSTRTLIHHILDTIWNRVKKTVHESPD